MKLGDLKKVKVSFSVYVLDASSIEKLKAKFPPKNEKFIGNHVTVKFPHEKGDPLPPPARLKVVGHVEEEGLEALIVSVDGKINRDDGEIYHITWSLDPAKKKPADSKALAKSMQNHYTLTLPIAIVATPEIVS